MLPRLIKFVRYCGGSTRFGRRMHGKVGIVAERAEGLGQKAEVAVPEKLVRADSEVGVEKNFQKNYKMPKRTKRRRVLKFRTRGFVHQERRCNDRIYTVGKHKQR